MTEQMDVDLPEAPFEARSISSRDPRLASRSRQPTLGHDSHTSVNTQVATPHTPSEVGESVPVDALARWFRDLVQASVTIENCRAGRERVQKRKDTAVDLLGRARDKSAFPSMSSFFDKSRHDEDENFRRVDSTMSDSVPVIRQSENNIMSFFGSMTKRSSKLEDEIAQLRTEFREKNDRLRTEFNEDNRRLRTELIERQSKMAEQQSQINELYTELDKIRATAQEARGEAVNAKEQQPRINELHTELDKIRAAAQEAKGEALIAKDNLVKSQDSNESNRQLASSVTILQDRVMMLERAMNNNSKSINGLLAQSRNSEDRMDRPKPASYTVLSSPPAYSKQLEDRIERPTLRLEDRIQSPTSARDKESAPPPYSPTEFDRRIALLDSEIADLVAFRQKCSGQFNEINNAISKHEEKVKLIDTIGENMGIINSRLIPLEKRDSVKGDASPRSDHRAHDVEMRLKALEEAPRMHPNPMENRCDALNSKIEGLTARFNELCDMQAMKDDLQLSEMEQIKTSLNQHSEQFPKQFADLRNDFEHVSTNNSRVLEEVKRTANSSNPAATSQEVVEHSAAIQKLRQVVETVRVGLYSLEMRYNSLSTEPIVKNMVVAMQEMYPSAGALTEQVASLRAQVERMAPADFKADVTAMKSEMVAIKTRVDQVSNGLVRMVTERVNHALFASSKLEERVNSQTSWPMQELKELQSNVAHLKSALNTHIAGTEQQIKTRETADRTLITNLNDERNRLEGQVQESTRTFTAEVADLKSAKTNQSKSIAEITESISDKMSRLDEFTSNELEVLQRQLDELSRQLANRNENTSEFGNQGRGIERVVSQSSLNAQSTPKEELSPVNSECGPEQSFQGSLREGRKDVESNAAIALRAHRKRSKKRSFATGPMSEDERSTTGDASPAHPTEHSLVGDTSAANPSQNPPERKKLKKKKKRRLYADAPIEVD